MSRILALTKKELKTYFGSPMAAIFIGAFLLSTLFSFFWIETFFARNIADIRPLFRWMPLLMIFLVAALTMRQWSEEEKIGTMEILLTLPVKLSHLVLGKFIAVLALVSVALLLTFGLPVTVSMLGNIDWGPVFGGYLGALLMASSYIAIGLFISSRTDNQIVSLILTGLVAGFFYILGSSGITTFMGNETGEFFRSLGTGSRFQSIERGVIDLRDLVYYGSLTAVFLTLNTVSLDKKRWSCGSGTAKYRRDVIIASILITLNLIALNLWLNKTHTLRLDLTEQKDYSISETTRDLVGNLTEPLILRGYFSEKTHPLLAPLVPRIKDFMKEYQVASGGKVKVTFVDPKFDEELEAEANEQYGIKPVPFQVSGRYEASVVNSYFNILIKYGDQYVTLSFDDLIEIQRRKDGQLDVGLRNLEYDLTKSIKKVVYGFQSLGSVFENVQKELKLTAVITPNSLPEHLKEMPKMINNVVAELTKESKGKLAFELIDPDNGNSQTRSQINQRFGITPQLASFFTNDGFYLYLFLSVGETSDRIYISGDMGEAEIREEIEAALKRTTSGFLKTVGIWTPKAETPHRQMFQQPQQNQDQYRIFKTFLRENYNLKEVDLATGTPTGDIDVLLVVAPQDLNDGERFAIDQYLMRGVSVVALSGNYLLDLNPYAQALNIKKAENTINDLLTHYGAVVEDAMVLDSQNEPFPIPVTRNIGGFIVQEIQQVNYPFFVDVRQDGMDDKSPIVANLQAVTMNWASPIHVDQERTKDKTVSVLLKSTPNSWIYSGTEIQPDFKTYPQQGFPVGDSLDSRPLAVSIIGSFSSYFADKDDPRLSKKDAIEEKDLTANGSKEEKEPPPINPIIKQSPESSRLVVVGSSEFLNDTVITISQSLTQDRFLNGLEFLQNVIDWSVEDESLLGIRTRGSHARLLEPMSRETQAFWEWMNYGVALAGLIAVSVYGARRRKKEKPILTYS